MNVPALGQMLANYARLTLRPVTKEVERRRAVRDARMMTPDRPN